MEIIREAFTEQHVSYALHFDWRDRPGAGFAFDCDSDGEPLPPKCEAAADNLRKCLDGTYDVVPQGVVTYRHSYRHPRVGRCDCGGQVYLDHFTNTCGRCGADYNMSGQRLAPREFWGEETGEHWSECY